MKALIHFSHRVSTRLSVLFSLLCGLCFFFTLLPTAEAKIFRCQSLLMQSSDIDLTETSAIRPVKGDPFLSFRASVRHYWMRLFEFANSTDNATRNVLNIKGAVVGDFHPGNIGDIELLDGRKTGLIDLDDVGISAPLLGDFWRGAIGVSLSPLKINNRDLWETYLLGLHDKRVKKPDLLIKIQKKSPEEFIKRQKSYIAELVNSQGKFRSSSGIISMEQAPYKAQVLFEKMRSSFDRLFLGEQILDIGFRMKLSGGSQKLPRYWYHVQSLKGGPSRVVEIKYLATPGTIEFGDQGRAQERISTAGAIYRPQEPSRGMFEVVEYNNNSFLARERLANYFNFDPIEMVKDLSRKDQREVILYLFNQLGRFQIRQAAGLALRDAIDLAPAKVYSDMLNFEKAYRDEIASASKK